MTELRDGFLYHPDDSGQLERLLAGEHNTAFDDPFRVAVHEAVQELRDEEEKERKALERLSLKLPQQRSVLRPPSKHYLTGRWPARHCALWCRT